MPFSSGTFTRTFDCTTDRDNGVKILASKFDTEFDGIATGRPLWDAGAPAACWSNWAWPPCRHEMAFCKL